MANFILALRTALAIIPEVIAIIRAVESGGGGQAKATAVIQIVLEAFSALPDELKGIIDATKFGQYLKKVIDIIVGLFNTLGVFGHKGTA